MGRGRHTLTFPRANRPSHVNAPLLGCIALNDKDDGDDNDIDSDDADDDDEEDDE